MKSDTLKKESADCRRRHRRDRHCRPFGAQRLPGHGGGKKRNARRALRADDRPGPPFRYRRDPVPDARTVCRDLCRPGRAHGRPSGPAPHRSHLPSVFPGQFATATDLRPARHADATGSHRAGQLRTHAALSGGRPPPYRILLHQFDRPGFPQPVPVHQPAHAPALPAAESLTPPQPLRRPVLQRPPAADGLHLPGYVHGTQPVRIPGRLFPDAIHRTVRRAVLSDGRHVPRRRER